MRVIASCEIRYYGPTKMVGKLAGEVALANLELSKREERKKRLSFQIDKTLSRFSKNQRDIIIKRYVEDEEVFDYMVYNESGMSEYIDRRNKSI